MQDLHSHHDSVSPRVHSGSSASAASLQTVADCKKQRCSRTGCDALSTASENKFMNVRCCPPLRALRRPRGLRGPAVVGTLDFQDAGALQRRRQHATAGEAQDAIAITVADAAGSCGSSITAWTIAVACRPAALICHGITPQVSADQEPHCTRGDLSILHKSWQRPCEGRWDAKCMCEKPQTTLEAQQGQH